jgi:aromatase
VTTATDRVTRHVRVVHAPAEVLYGLVADVTRWPVLFGPSIDVHHLERNPGRERFRLWASVGGRVANWTSERTLDSSGLRITFDQEHSRAPITSMGGAWNFRPLPGGRTEVVLDHHFAANGQRPLELLADAVDRNSEDELTALERFAELDEPIEEIVATFEDTVRLPVGVAEAYGFIRHSDEWPDRLPHVRRVVLREDQEGVQNMEMDTVIADGSAHTTSSVRLCFSDERIVYKQVRPPAMMLGHCGAWYFAPAPDDPAASLVTARHTVAVDPGAARKMLGPRSTLADAHCYLREALGRNSSATLVHAGQPR